MYKKIAAQKAKLTDKLTGELSKKIKAIQRAFFSHLRDNYLYSLDIVDGKISQNTKNLALTRNLSNYAAQYTDQKNGTLSWLVNGLIDVLKLNGKYFRAVTDKDLRREDADVMKYLFDRIGYDGGKFVKNGWLYDLEQDDTVIRKAKAECLKAVAAGVSFGLFKTQIEEFVIGGKGLGLLEREWKQIAEDSFSNFDRGISNEYAVNLKLDWAIYQGGLMDTTRPFCAARNNKVYSRAEVLSWANLSFEGKPKVYDPIVDLGGYRCRHTLDWISEELAREIAPEKF